MILRCPYVILGHPYVILWASYVILWAFYVILRCPYVMLMCRLFWDSLDGLVKLSFWTGCCMEQNSQPESKASIK